VFILNYDENDGLFDHVPPPTPPAGTPGEFLTDSPLASGSDGFAGPIGGGFRVPCLIVSPWTQGGWVASETFDHTSLLRFLEVLTGVPIPNITPWRRASFGDLTSALGMAQFPSAVRHLPDTKPLVAAAVEEVTSLPFPSTPGPDGPHPSPANIQVAPVQDKGPVPRHRPASAQRSHAHAR
jgi:phospholipase C